MGVKESEGSEKGLGRVLKLSELGMERVEVGLEEKRDLGFMEKREAEIAEHAIGWGMN